MSVAEPVTTSPRAIIEARTLGAIEVALLSHARDVHVGAGAKRLAAQATTEYHDRFLIELVQNAHDAHRPTESTGEIEILLAREEGRFGTLYVANGGRPFSTSNFKTICEIGLSDKLPGEAIGNKGIGFKSVLQICSRPEIYSAEPDVVATPRDSFTGFCFSFATDDQLVELLDGDRARFEIVRRETATFHLPVPLDVQPDVVKAFAQRGFATVVRLPLNREGAIDDVDGQLNALRAGSAPLLLFLSRLRHLAISETGAASTGRVDLYRDAEKLAWPDAPEIDVSRVDLREQGRYLCASVTIEAKDVAAVVATAVEAQELEETWLEWREDAVVTAAVRLDAPTERGRLYTYLPMEVRAPFAGHLNAPFYARLDRRDLNRDLSLNALLLDAGAQACGLAAKAIATRNDRGLASAAVDFFAWDPSESGRLQDALSEAEPATEAAVLPVVGADGHGWASLATSHRWDGRDRRILTTEAIAQAADVYLVDLDLGDSRLDRIERLHSALLSRDMAPTHEELADWSERLAAGRAGRRPSISWWNSLYDELADVFEHHGDDLQGRRILLDEENELRAAGTTGNDERADSPSVFFQPVRERAEGVVDIDAADDVRIPKTLRRRIVFLHPQLVWLERVGNTRRKKRARVFLEEHDLVKPYAARSLLEHLRDLLQESRSKDVSRDALRLAFRLQRTRDYDQRPALRDLGLRVPCRGGWVRAGEAHFSGFWPATMGGELERLIELSAGASNDLTAVERTLLLPPDEWPLSVNAEDWTDFLREAGVRDGLWPITIKRARAQERGWAFEPETVGKQVGLTEPELSRWAQAVVKNGRGPQHGRGVYRNRTPFYSLPGQADYADLSHHARREYGALVAASCGQWSDEHFSIRIQRSDVSSYNLDPFSWPTPATAFLEGEKWMPMATPQARDEITFVCLRDAWHFSDRSVDGDEYAQPDYAPLVPLRLRRALDARPPSLQRLREHGLNVWNDPADAARLVQHLGRLVQSDLVTDQYAANVRRAYEQAWEHALECGAGENAASSAYFVVTRSGQLDAFDPMADTDAPLYVHDGGSRLADSLLRLSSRALIDIDGRAGGDIAELLRERLGPRVLRTSHERLVVMDAGDPVVPDASWPLLLSADLAWLDGLVMAVLELRRGAFRKLTGQVRERVVQTLRSVKLRFAHEILLQIGNEILSPPYAMRDAVPLPDERDPALIVRGTGPTLSWAQLETVLPALADLLGYAELAPAMQLAVTRLTPGDGEPPVTAPSVRELADALDEPEQRVREVISSLRGSAAALLDLLAPALVVLVGPDEYERLAADAREIDDEEELFTLVSGLELRIPPEELRSVARGADVDDLRRGLGITLAEVNRALRALGRPPIHYTEEHAQAFATFIGTHRDETLSNLRRAYLPLFRNGAPLDAYVAARDGLRSLGPDPAWLEEHEVPPDVVMKTRVDGWLYAATADLQPADDVVKPLDVVQRDNRGLLREILGSAQRTILAWSQLHGRDVPYLWNRADLESTVWDGLLAEGATDFDPIDAEGLIGWLAQTGAWPDGMPQTLSFKDLGLTQDAVERAKTEEERERAHREFLRRSIELGGTRYSASPENFAAIAQAVRASVTESLLRTRAGFSHLAEPVVRTRRGGTSTGTKGAPLRPTEAQRSAIGLVGEVVALEWLKRRYSGASDDSWKSGYRDFVLGGSLGNDSLGFDFEVPVGRTSYFFEVKATVGDEMQIELGESEVLAARQHARTDRYRILYIPSAQDPARRAIYVLPNPFAERGRDLYQLEGSGLRYRFQLEAAIARGN
jgi:hypothetical protein